ncbi:thioredoxin domain-containing protein 15-like [Nilaparvata lugens]|uniref:thioredoxin domain-containing protein 15-like n=1 Tax=Nilaparvata lugens TaxID=108931 RepID=UPI00193E25E8|nr:thioredoxin domain-containing protein 15-like [Nilaparvata lugens]
MKNIKTTFIICLSISIAFGIEPAFGVEYGPQFEELAPVDPPKQEIIEEKNEDAPTDVISLSNFIKEFHQSLSKDLYSLYSTVKSKIPPPTTEETSTDVKRMETPTFESDADDIVTFASNHTNGSSNSTVDKVGETKSASSNSTLINCNIDRQQNSLTVELVNSTRLMNMLTTLPNITSKTTKADCTVVLFFSRTCPFSCMAAPHFNALPRAFPSIKIAAIRVTAYQSVNTHYGIIGVPTIMLFHNGRAAAKFNDTEYTLEMFSRFITKTTGVKPEEKMFVTSADFGGPVPSVIAKERDYLLILSWMVIVVVLGYFAQNSRAFIAMMEAIENTWRETEVHHPHVE